MFLRTSPLPGHDSIELDGADYAYRIRIGRRRTLALELRADGSLTVATPPGQSLAFIRRFVASRRRWIDRKRALLAALPPVRPVVLQPGARLPYLGTELELAIETGPSRRRSRCRREGQRLIVETPSPQSVPQALERWYRDMAAGHCAERVAYFAEQVGRAPARITIRAARTRWGSCTSRGTVSFNWRLMLLPPECLDYVVVHELCHLLVPNHSPRFWEAVARILPDFSQRRAALRQLGTRLPL